MTWRIILILMVLLSLPVQGEIVAAFSEPLDPSQLLLDDERVYVLDFPFVYIYSKSDHSLIAKLGGEGEGPRQFHYSPGSLVNKIAAFHAALDGGRLVISSQGKVSFYSSDGTYIREMRTQHRHDHRFSPMGDKYIGLTARRGADNIFYLKVGIYNSALENEKDVYQFERFSQPPNGDVNVVYDPGVLYDQEAGLIFATAVGRPGSVIDVFDPTGKRTYSVSYPYETPVLGEEDRARYLDYYRAGPLKFVWDKFKKQIRFPENFPGLRDFRIDSGKIYVVSFKGTDEGSELVILDARGRFHKKMEIPLKEKDINLYPYCIHRGILFQLVENLDEERWELLSWPVH
jgi:hypothetical protein